MRNGPGSVTGTKSHSDKVLGQPRRAKLIAVYPAEISMRRMTARKMIRISSIQGGRGRGGDM